MGESILSRASTSTATFTPAQTQVDVAVSSGTRQITDPKFIAASLVGGGAALGTVKVGNRISPFGYSFLSGKTLRNSLAFASPIVGSTVHEFTYRSLEHFIGPENPNRWELSGKDGVGAGLVRSNLTFGPSLGGGLVGAASTGALINPRPPLGVRGFGGSFTKGQIFVMGAGGVLAFLGSYWGTSQAVNYFENFIFEDTTKRESVEKPELKSANQ